MKQLLQALVGGLFALVVLFVPLRSEAAQVRLTLGADYHFDQQALFELMGSVDFHIAGPLYLGPRIGLGAVTRENGITLPLDLDLRLAPRSAPVYVELLLGPWIFFQGDTLRAHGAVGFGYQGRSFNIGIEVGYLDPAATLGLRVGWRF